MKKKTNVGLIVGILFALFLLAAVLFWWFWLLLCPKVNKFAFEIFEVLTCGLYPGTPLFSDSISSCFPGRENMETIPRKQTLFPPQSLHGKANREIFQETNIFAMFPRLVLLMHGFSVRFCFLLASKGRASFTDIKYGK